MTRALIIANPVAAAIRDPRARAAVLTSLAAALEARGLGRPEVIEPASSAATRGAAAAAVAQGLDLVVAVGGDGTARAVASALAGSGTALGLVPGGTGNLFATALGVPSGTAAAIHALRAARPRQVDLAHVAPAGPSGPAMGLAPLADDDFLVAAGTGLDARMILATSHEHKARLGVGAYVLGALAATPRAPVHPTALEVDGSRVDLEALVVIVVNAGDLLPGLVRPRLPIVADDGLLDVFALSGQGLLGGLTAGLAMLAAGEPGRSWAGLRLRGRVASVAMTPPEPIEIDGDPYAPGGFTASVRPGALRVLLP